MGQLDHWNAALESRKLKRKPVGVKIAGQEVVLFRTQPGQVGALDDVCIHRRMRLSCGHVEGACVVCPYHGWKFTADGHGTSPGTPRMHGEAVSFDVREAYGIIWVKAAGVDAEFPDFALPGYYRVTSDTFTAEAPLELVIDNFCELEHSGTTHMLFGYDLDRMHEMTFDVRSDEHATYCRTVGPHKPIAWFQRKVFGLGKEVTFTSTWTTRFSPVQTIADHALSDTVTGRPARLQWRVGEFYTPIDAERTLVTIVVLMKSNYPGTYGGIRLFKPVFKRLANSEIERDIAMLASIADKDTSLEGMRLSRFDKVHALNRERLNRVYRGIELPRPVMHGPIMPSPIAPSSIVSPTFDA